MLRRLYDWTMGMASHKRAMPAMAAVSFADSSFFPIPPDIMMIPMILARRERAWTIAFVATVASVLGAVLGYGIGFLFVEEFGYPLLELYGYLDKFTEFQEGFREWGWWIVLGAGFTPFPFKVITIASGVAGLDFTVFIAASLVGRGLRFYLEAALLWRFGPPIRGFVEKNLGLVAGAGFVALLAAFLVLKAV